MANALTCTSFVPWPSAASRAPRTVVSSPAAFYFPLGKTDDSTAKHSGCVRDMRPTRRETICRARGNSAFPFAEQREAKCGPQFWVRRETCSPRAIQARYGFPEVDNRNLLREILFSQLTAFPPFSLFLSFLLFLSCPSLPSLTCITTPTQRDARQSTAPTRLARSRVPPHDELRLISDIITDLHDKSLTRNVITVGLRRCSEILSAGPSLSTADFSRDHIISEIGH